MFLARIRLSLHHISNPLFVTLSNFSLVFFSLFLLTSSFVYTDSPFQIRNNYKCNTMLTLIYNDCLSSTFFCTEWWLLFFSFILFFYEKFKQPIRITCGMRWMKNFVPTPIMLKECPVCVTPTITRLRDRAEREKTFKIKWKWPESQAKAYHQSFIDATTHSSAIKKTSTPVLYFEWVTHTSFDRSQFISHCDDFVSIIPPGGWMSEWVCYMNVLVLVPRQKKYRCQIVQSFTHCSHGINYGNKNVWVKRTEWTPMKKRRKKNIQTTDFMEILL